MLNRSGFAPFHSFVVAGVYLACTLPVMAQEERAASQSGEVLEEIITTGSRIKRADYDGPQPIVVFNRVYLEATGFKDVGDFSRYLPQSHQTINARQRFACRTLRPVPVGGSIRGRQRHSDVGY